MFRKKYLIECQKIDANRVKYQLDRHQHGDEVFSNQETVNPDKEHSRGQDQEPLNGYTFKHMLSIININLFFS